jgi:hypothetical protein
VDGPIRIDHEQSARFTSIQASVNGRDLTGFVQEAQQAVTALKLPPELQVVWGGQFENQQRAAARLSLVIPAALGLIFVILMLTFGSATQALIILANIPFALVGGVVALAVSGEYLSVPASVGFIALLGIAVLNGVVMVTHFNERLLSGEPMATVVRLGTERRLRPVLMTAVITVLGMIPLLFATGPGSEIQRPLAIVVTGGLFSSTLLTLLTHGVLPVINENDTVVNDEIKFGDNDTLGALVSQQVIDEVIERGLIEVLPLTHIRGRSLHDSYVIVDEAQSLERGVLLTVLSRIGQGSRVVLTHDVAQRDNLRVGRHDGVVAVVESLKGHPLFAHITLTRSERSQIAALVTEMLEEPINFSS